MLIFTGFFTWNDNFGSKSTLVHLNIHEIQKYDPVLGKNPWFCKKQKSETVGQNQHEYKLYTCIESWATKTFNTSFKRPDQWLSGARTSRAWQYFYLLPHPL